MRYFLLISIIITIIGCKKPLGSDQEYRDLRFFVEQKTTTQIASFSGISLPINLPMFDITFNLTDTGSINEPYLGMIDDIYLHSLKMELISPSNLDFGFIDDFEMFISSI